MEGIHDPTPWLYSGRVGHDVSEGFCSCGGYHVVEDRIVVGSKTPLVTVDGEAVHLEWFERREVQP